MVKGIKIHLAVDKYGSPLAINVSPANIHDSRDDPSAATGSRTARGYAGR
jgi:hypothetical protein